MGEKEKRRSTFGHHLTTSPNPNPNPSPPPHAHSYTPATWFPGPVYTIPPQIANLDPNAELVREMADSCAAKVTIAGVGGCEHPSSSTPAPIYTRTWPCRWVRFRAPPLFRALAAAGNRVVFRWFAHGQTLNCLRLPKWTNRRVRRTLRAIFIFDGDQSNHCGPAGERRKRRRGRVGRPAPQGRPGHADPAHHREPFCQSAWSKLDMEPALMRSSFPTRPPALPPNPPAYWYPHSLGS